MVCALGADFFIYMERGNYKYIWRCAKCSNHFSNILKIEGSIIQEKKCPKCKSINVINFDNKDVNIKCRFYDPDLSIYKEDANNDFVYQ